MIEEYTEEEIKEIYSYIDSIDHRHKPYLCVDSTRHMIVYKEKCCVIPKEMFDFMESNKNAMEYISKCFIDSLGYDVTDAFDDEKASVLERNIFFDGNFLDSLISYGKHMQENKNKPSLFGDIGISTVKKPIPIINGGITRNAILEEEKKYLGVYLSGHPLDEYSEKINKLIVGVDKIKTKKYGSVCLFESIQELIESKYNKCIVVCYCSSAKFVPRKRYTLKEITLETKKQSYTFVDKENQDQRSSLFFVDKDYETNKISSIEQNNAYLVLLERNKFLVNEAQIIDSFKLKG